MALLTPAQPEPRLVLRGLRAAMNGSGPALALGMSDAEVASAPPPPAGTVAVVRTSGSTGEPKSVILSRSAVTASALATADRIGAGRWLLALPATYVAGLQVLVRALVSGHEPAILAGRFSAASFTAAARSFVSEQGGVRAPTYTSLVPAQLASLLDAAGFDDDTARALRSFEAILVGGQRLRDDLRERASALGARIVRTYGSSETAGGCVYDGRALDGVRLRVEDEEVWICGPMLSDGYLGEPERTSAAFTVDAEGTRWYRTGDRGALVDGVLTVTGRRDNVIVSGGVNVSLDRVESLVRSLPGLADAVVVGVPDDRWGEVPTVFAAGAAEVGIDQELLERMRVVVGSSLGVAARPAALVRGERVPMLDSGKPDRRAVAAYCRRSLGR